MKTVVNDKDKINSLCSRINSWISHQSNGQFANSFNSEKIIELIEYPSFRLIYKVELETRTLSQFSRPDDKQIETPAAILSPDKVDIWQIESEKVKEFINYKQVLEIEGSLTSAQCRLCFGRGAVSCSVCNGEKGIVCAKCMGDGKIVCPACKRSKIILCTKCSGRGRVYSESQEDYAVCSECGGKGSFSCDNCAEGYVICQACQGKKRLPCDDCGGAGEIKCKECSGKGQIISGYRIEAIFKPIEEKAEIENNEIPKNIINTILPKSAYIFDRNISNEEIDNKSISDEILTKIELLKNTIHTDSSNRIVYRTITLEKKSVYLLRYNIGGNETQAWIADSGARVFCEHKLLTDFYVDIIDELKQKITKGKISDAAALCSTIQKVKGLEKEIEDIYKLIRKKLYIFSNAGAFLGAVVFSVFTLPIIFSSSIKSLHHNYVIILSIVINVLTGAIIGEIVFLIRFGFLNRILHRLMTGFILAAVTLYLFYNITGMIDKNFAMNLDKKAFEKEYNRYFPFGLRTLSKNEDIIFLEKLSAKYKPAGIDVSLIEKNIEWLKAKEQNDENNLQKIEKTRQEIEESRKKQPFQKKFLRHSHISIK